MIVAIDGPAGAGKSTVAKALAGVLGVPFLDTGAMYRAITWKVLEDGFELADAEACASLARRTHLAFSAEGLCVDGVLRGAEIRSADVDKAVSIVAAHSGVRAAIVPLQREMAAEAGGAVAEGRDVTTVVFPEADHRFFLSASAEERARRRTMQRRAGEGSAGEDGAAGEGYELILAAIKRRDHLDSTRADSPLMRGEGVSVVDTGTLEASEVVKLMLSIIKNS
ncbi:MAG: (d)CMP kinase [Planctomycetota bacterium]|nr:(d)CMP kinase [Planctomycetota bacterium]